MKHLSLLLLFFLYETRTDYTKLLVENVKIDRNLKFFLSFLQKYQDFQIILHTDNETNVYVQNLLNSIIYTRQNSYRTLLIYNHDTLPNGTDFVRPTTSKVVNLFFSENTYLWNRLAQPQKLHYNDVVIFEERENKLMDKLATNGEMFLKLAGKVLVLKRELTGVAIYSACFYCGLLSKKFELLEVVENGIILTGLDKLHPHTFRDMNGHLFHTEFIQYFPYIICERNATVLINGKKCLICTDIRGIESNLMRTMSKKLNFTFLVHIMDSNASFFDMVKDVNHLKTDIAFGGLSMTADRIPLVQFTKQYNFEDFIFLYIISLSFQEIFDKFMEPFTAVAVWSLYITSFLVLSASLYFAVKINTNTDDEDINFWSVLWAFFHMLFEQSNANINYVYRSKVTCALILALWWWASLILLNVYKSTMLSTVVHPPNTEPESLRQLVKAGYIVAGNAQFSDIIRDLLMVSDPLYREALRKTVYGENTCDVFKKILPGHVAMLDESSTLQYEVRTLCEEPIENKLSMLRIARKPVRSTGHAWALQIGAPFRHTFDYYLSLVLSGGLFKKWTQEATSKLAGSLIPKSRENKGSSFMRLSVKGIFPLLAIYSVGALISILCFFLEFIVHRYFKK